MLLQLLLLAYVWWLGESQTQNWSIASAHPLRYFVINTDSFFHNKNLNKWDFDVWVLIIAVL